jgi:hypothetical protein
MYTQRAERRYRTCFVVLHNKLMMAGMPGSGPGPTTAFLVLMVLLGSRHRLPCPMETAYHKGYHGSRAAGLMQTSLVCLRY